MLIAKRIRELRTDRNISRENLSKEIGVSVRTLSYWENQINEPKAGYIFKLAKFFGVSADYLLGLED